MLKLPGMKGLRPWARQVAAVAEHPALPGVKRQRENRQDQACRGISVMSANLWHDWPRFRQLTERLEAFARLAEGQGADILLLQEVARKPDLHADEWLAERLGMGYVYSRANGHQQIGFEEGIAIFSRFPLGSPELVQLGEPGNPFVRRMALGAQVDTPCGDLMAFSVHLGLRSKANTSQVDHLHRWVGQLSPSRTALVGGDFNSPETSPQIQGASSAWVDTYRQANPHGDGHTHTLRWPWGGVIRRQRLDYIFLVSEQAGWQVLEARHLAAPGLAHSDHQAVMARLAPPAGPSG